MPIGYQVSIRAVKCSGVQEHYLAIYLQTDLCFAEYEIECDCDLMRGNTMERANVLRDCSMVDKLVKFKLVDGI